MVINPPGQRTQTTRHRGASMPRNSTASLKKNELQPWRKKRYCIPEKDAARFCAQMEDILEVYTSHHEELKPLICMDESSKQLLNDLVASQPMQPGRVACEDHHYERNGVCALFVFFDPIRGWRRVSVRESRTRVDWAEEIKQLLTVDYPHARRVKLVCDNLNTHHIASLYEAFPAQEAREYAKRIEIHYTPRNGSWLNMAEIELSVLGEQCLDRRIGTKEQLMAETKVWTEHRNREASQVVWRFSLEDARVKLVHLYPRTLN
jgi:hypothetical protein